MMRRSILIVSIFLALHSCGDHSSIDSTDDAINEEVIKTDTNELRKPSNHWPSGIFGYDFFRPTQEFAESVNSKK